MLRLVGISKYYSSKDNVTQALDSINLSFSLNEFVAITGESGSGKSTLLNVLSGLDTYEEGELYINGEETSYYTEEDFENYRKQYIGFVFQNFNIIDSYTVYQNIYVALTLQGVAHQERKRRTLDLIEKVGLSAQTHQRASKLSGGQKQRVSIARALAKNAPIIVCDEPTGNLDTESSKVILTLLKEIAKDKLVIVVTHNYDEIKPYVTRRVRLFDGEVVEDVTLVENEKTHEKLHIEPKGLRKKDLFLMALRNLVATPKKTVLSFLIAFVTVMVFTIVYGNGVSARYKGDGVRNDYFNNPFAERVTISRLDYQPFTESEIDAFANHSLINEVYRYDSLFDHRVYIERTYEGEYINGSEWDGTYHTIASIFPASILREGELIEGRLPENANEVVINSRSPEKIGDTITYFYEDDTNQTVVETIRGPMVIGHYWYRELTVVGRTNRTPSYAPRLYLDQSYFHDNDFVFWSMSRYDNEYWLTSGPFRFALHPHRVIKDETLPPNTQQLRLQGSFIFTFMRWFEGPENMTRADLEQKHVNLSFLHRGDLQFSPKETGIVTEDGILERLYVNVSPDVYQELITFLPYQLSVLVSDAFDAQLLRNEFRDQGYSVVYPASLSENVTYGNDIFDSIFLTISAFFLLVIMYYVAFLSLKNVQMARLKDFVILRSIGSSRKDISYMTILEWLYIMAIALIVTYIIFVINITYPLGLENYLRFFRPRHYLLVASVLFILAILLATRFNKKIFGRSVIRALRVE